MTLTFFTHFGIFIIHFGKLLYHPLPRFIFGRLVTIAYKDEIGLVRPFQKYLIFRSRSGIIYM
nr:MAG TPA: hypothetical protein [Caudoviricetes sp.]